MIDQEAHSPRLDRSCRPGALHSLALDDISVLFVALPHLSADLHTTDTQQLWISVIYGFVFAGFLVTMGTVGDRIGRRRLPLIYGTPCSWRRRLGTAPTGVLEWGWPASPLLRRILNGPQMPYAKAPVGTASGGESRDQR
jgi:MFS family permease